MDNGQFTDEELTAFLDGEAAPDLVARIAQAEAQDTALAARLGGLRAAGLQMTEAYDALIAQAPAMPPLAPSQATTPRPARRFGMGVMVAASAAALVIGLGLGSLRPGAGAAPLAHGWMEYVAAYQALYVPETLGQIEPSPAERRGQLDRLGLLLGLDLPLPEVAGLTYARGQLLGFEGAPLVQLAFMTEAGLPVALCIIERPGAADAEVALEDMEGLEAAYWVKDGYGFLLIGTDDRSFIAESAEAFSVAL